MQPAKTPTAEIKSLLDTTNNFKFHFALLDPNNLQNFTEHLSFDTENSIEMDYPEIFQPNCLTKS